MGARTAALVTLVVAACAALAGGPVAAATPGYCRGDAPIDSEQLPERIKLAGCEIVGRTIVADGLRVVVPPPGRGRSIHALQTDGETALTVRTTPDGYVEVTQEEETRVVTSPLATSNDAFASATLVDTPTSYDWSRSGTTVDATVEAQDATADEVCETPADQVPDRSVWYRYKAKHSGVVKVVLANVDPVGAAVKAQVFQSSGLWRERCTTEPVYVTQGSVYFIRVASRGAPASFSLRWFPPRPATDHFGSAPYKAVPSYTRTAKMTGATIQSGEPKASCNTTWTGTVWQKVNAGTLRRLDVNTSGQPAAVYQGSTLTGLKQIACVGGWGKLVILPRTGPFYIQQWTKPGTDEADLYVNSGEPYPDSPPPCSDKSYYLMDVGPRKAFRWRYNGGNAPSSIATGALTALQQGIGVITKSTNDCGLGDQVSAAAEYLGRTTRTATLCTQGVADGLNAVDFGPAASPGVLGLACSEQGSTDGITWRITETDLRFTKGEAWTLKPDAANCSWAHDLVGVAAHEAGHTFGLDHPYGVGNLTMAAYSSACTGAFRTLGRGDVLGLRALY